MGEAIEKRVELNVDGRLQDACEELREHVDNLGKGPSIILAGNTYKERIPGKVYSVTVDGVVIGYRPIPTATGIVRQVFIKIPGEDIGEIPDGQRNRIMAAVFNVFVVPGAALPEIQQIAPDAILLTQQVIMMQLVERNPGLVSITGGFGGGNRKAN